MWRDPVSNRKQKIRKRKLKLQKECSRDLGKTCYISGIIVWKMKRKAGMRNEWKIKL